MKFSQNRLALAALLVPMLYLLITFLPPFAFFILVLFVILMAQWEFYHFHPLEGVHPLERAQPASVYLGLIFGALMASHFYRTTPWPFDFLVMAIFMGLLIFQLLFFRQITHALSDSAVIFTGIFYPAFFLGHLIALRQMGPGGVGFILFLLFVIWGGDAGAYYVGRAVGGKKLYPAVSPNKTVSGGIGGLFTSVCGGVIVKLLFPLFPLTWNETIPLAMLLGAIGQVGDFVESLFKRSAGVKDSSRLIAAHGGILDKLDGVAFAAPVLYYYLLWQL